VIFHSYVNVYQMVYPVFYNVLHPKVTPQHPSTAARLLRTVSLMAPAPMVPGR
jgi:hypothetical protein